MDDIGILDVLNIISLGMQMENMSSDEKQTNYIRKVIKAIANEIELLHKENDIIMKQNEEILEKIDNL